MPRRVSALAFSVVATALAFACSDVPTATSPSADGDAGAPDPSETDAGSDSAATKDAEVAIGCTEPAAGASPSDPFRRARAASDLPDDAPGEYQIHLAYVEPGDRSPEARLDENGAIRRSVTAWNAWLAARLGGPKLRIDTCKGVLDVTHVKLPANVTEAAMAQGTGGLQPGGPSWIRDRIEDLLAPTFNDPKKITLAFYDGLAFGSCAQAPLPPGPGRMAVVYVGGIYASSYLTAAAPAGATQLSVPTPSSTGLRTTAFAAKLGTESVSVTSVSGTTVTLAAPLAAAHPAGELLVANDRAPDCRQNPYSSDGAALGYADYTGVHEMLHALGIVASDAKFHAAAYPGHLTKASAGGTNDLMFQGPEAWACASGIHASPAASPCVLDPGHTSYVNLAGAPGVDLAKSVFLTPTPAGALPPPGW